MERTQRIGCITSLHLDDDKQVAKADDEQRAKESQHGGVENKGGGPDVLGLGPDHVAGVERFLGVTKENFNNKSKFCNSYLFFIIILLIPF